MPTAGDLRDTVAVEQLATPATADAHGQLEETWERIDTVRACIRELSGSELWRVRQQASEANVAIDLRYYPKFAAYQGGVHQGPLMRLVEVRNDEDFRVLNISAVTNPDRKRIWHLVLAKA
jgi:head-tail adaptor